ncbi:MAG: CheR family methyltransferase [Solirubrobacterales bacterium]
MEKHEQITDAEFEQLTGYMKQNYGIYIKPEKKYLVVGRLQSYLLQHGFDDFSAFYKYLMTDKTGEASIEIVNRLTTNHTFFMREVDHFEYFKSIVLPYLTTRYGDSKDLRVWSAGCSSGEEPYTLAMLIADHLGHQRPQWDAKILATDISTRVIKTATRGIYSNEQTVNLPPQWLKSYFKSVGSSSGEIVESVRNEVLFRPFNLMTPTFPFKKRFHVIFCRNVMIYFDNPTKYALVQRFYDVLEPGGYFFIGHSETLNREDTPFQYIKPAIYRKV